MARKYEEEKDDRGGVFLKYLLFVFNFLFWMGGAAVIAVGAWTLMEKSSYINFLATSTLAVSAYILLFAGGMVMVTGFLGCGAMIREHKGGLSVYLSILISVYAAELAAGVLAYLYHEMISEELKQNLNKTMVETYADPGKKHITNTIDQLQQDGGCITKLDGFIQEHLLLIGAVSIGIACLQLVGVLLTACFLCVLYREEKEDSYDVM